MMAEVSNELLDKLYKQAQRNPTEFFMRILENQNYDPQSIDELRSDISKELKQCETDAATLLGLL
jgi:hypothetical protein